MLEKNKTIANMLNVHPEHSEIKAEFRKTEHGKPLVVVTGLPEQNEALTPDRVRLLAERLYQIAATAERENHNEIALVY